jgi:hypothetical protein
MKNEGGDPKVRIARREGIEIARVSWMPKSIPTTLNGSPCARRLPTLSLCSRKPPSLGFFKPHGQ